jgi:hypothetical protein
VGLTPPSRGRPQAGFAHLRPPLTSNVRPPYSRMPAGLLVEPPVNLIMNTPKFVAVAFWESANQDLRGLRGLSVLRLPARGWRSVNRPPSAGVRCLVRPGATGVCLLPRIKPVSLGELALTESVPMLQGFAVRPVCQRLSSQSKVRSLAMRSISLASLRPWPNPSVKGTGLRPAPYVER